MLLQSHDDYIHILPALPSAWNEGSYEGLVARGNFVVSAIWKNGKAVSIEITSRAGKECKLRYPGIEKSLIADSEGKIVNFTLGETGNISFKTETGAHYRIVL